MLDFDETEKKPQHVQASMATALPPELLMGESSLPPTVASLKPDSTAPQFFDLVDSQPASVPPAPQEDFGEFYDAAPAVPKNVVPPSSKEEPKPISPEQAKGTLWDDAKDMMDMNDLMTAGQQFKGGPAKPAQVTFHQALYGNPARKGLY